MDYYKLGRDCFFEGVEECPVNLDAAKFTRRELKEMEGFKKDWWDGWLDARTEKSCGFSHEEWVNFSIDMEPEETKTAPLELTKDRFNVYDEKDIDWP